MKHIGMSNAFAILSTHIHINTFLVCSAMQKMRYVGQNRKTKRNSQAKENLYINEPLKWRDASDNQEMDI